VICTGLEKPHAKVETNLKKIELQVSTVWCIAGWPPRSRLVTSQV
jgi:hypothetical protein